MTKEEFMERAHRAIQSSPDDLRAKGLMVAAHNDYKNSGGSFTFWLMTLKTDDGIKAYKGEGRTDADALDEIRRLFAKDSDKLHHAPMCPANHYHGQKAPDGPCSCGAVEMEKE